MSNYTTASSLLAAVVMGAALALALVLWRSADRIADPRLRWIAGGFGIFAAKHAFSIYTIQVTVAHHEVTEMIGTAFDVAMIACMSMPLLLRRA